VEKDAQLLVGKITTPHGIRGAVRVLLYADVLALFESDRSVFLHRPGETGHELRIRWIKPYKKRGALILFDGVENRDHAEQLVGLEILIDKSRLPQLEEGEYYWFEIIGMTVFDENGNHLGQIASIIETGSNDVYVTRKGEREILIPALESVVEKIDLDDRKMVVRLPDGL
jgi:16S rRNA processing protein RimM